MESPKIGQESDCKKKIVFFNGDFPRALKTWTGLISHIVDFPPKLILFKRINSFRRKKIGGNLKIGQVS